MMVRVFLIGPRDDWQRLLVEKEILLIILSTVLIAAGGYIINDYYDVKIDALNKPDRVVIDRSMKRRVALLVHFILNITGILLGLLITWKLSAIYLGVATMLWLYSNSLKRQPLIGNITIALLSAVTIWVLAAFYRNNEYLIYIYGLFAFMISLIRELVKDIQDMKGDATFGCKTLPIVWGIPKTKILLYVISITFLSTVVLFLYPDYWNILLFQFIFVFPLVVLFIFLLARADTTRKFRMLSHFCKLILLTGVSSMVLYY